MSTVEIQVPTKDRDAFTQTKNTLWEYFEDAIQNLYIL